MHAILPQSYWEMRCIATESLIQLMLGTAPSPSTKSFRKSTHEYKVSTQVEPDVLYIDGRGVSRGHKA